RMLELREEGASLNDMAVLYRSHYQSMEIQMELTKRGIPYVVRSGLRFFEEAHIKDVLAYLKVLHNPRDEISWSRILKLLPKVGEKTAAKIFLRLSESGDPLAEIRGAGVLSLLPSGAERSFKSFQATVEQLKEKIASPAEMVKTVSKSNNYEEYLKSQYANYRERMEDLDQLGSYAVQFKNLEEFLSALALVSEIEAETVVDRVSRETEACVLSTVHQAKGLEWKAVFVVWLADGRFPSYLSFNKEEEIEEERRLFYVAVTRAKDELYLSYPIVYSGYDGEVLMKVSRFVEELPEHLYEKWEIAEESVFGGDPEKEIDLSEYREVKLKSPAFEAIDIKDLDFMR
ncbi:ATP-dependent helicase, partial [Candidatus Saganbacteria bacterium]|nr:ATP-dependent helicase [Candidatus Saganbacteria bacterium]